MLAKSSLASNCTKWVLFYNRFSEVIFLFSIPKSKQKHSHRGTKSWEIWDHSGTGGCPWRSWCNWREGSRDLCHFCDLNWSHQGLFWLTWIWSTHCEKIHERESTERERESTRAMAIEGRFQKRRLWILVKPQPCRLWDWDEEEAEDLNRP